MGLYGYTGVYTQEYTWVCMGILGYSYVVYKGIRGYIFIGYLFDCMVP